MVSFECKDHAEADACQLNKVFWVNAEATSGRISSGLDARVEDSLAGGAPIRFAKNTTTAAALEAAREFLLLKYVADYRWAH